MINEKTYYEVLGVKPDVPQEEIKKAYRKISKQFHPDIYKGEDVHIFKEAAEAYAALEREDLREIYDNYLKDFYTPKWSFADLFSHFINKNQPSVNGSNIEVVLSVTPQEWMASAVIPIKYHRIAKCTCAEVEICTHCKGAGYIKKELKTMIGTHTTTEHCPNCKGAGEIRQHVEGCGDGTRYDEVIEDVQVGETPFIVKGGGQKGTNGGINGDLIVHIEIDNGEWEVTEFGDYQKTINVSFVDYLKETEVEVILPNGEVTSLIPEMNRTVCLQNKAPNQKSVYINFKTEVTLSSEQKKALLSFWEGEILCKKSKD